jgi:hypothetical protein
MGAELWRIQLFERRGSDYFFYEFVRDALLAGLTDLARRAPLQASLNDAREELRSLVARAEHVRSISDKPVFISGGVLPIMDRELSNWSNYSSAVDKPVDVEKLSDKARHPGFVVGFRTWRRPANLGRKPVLNKLGLSAKLMGNGATHFALHGISRNPGRIWPARWESGPILFLQRSARQPRGGWAGPKPCYGCPCHFPIAWRKPAVEPLSSGRALTSKSLTGVKEFETTCCYQ